MYVVLVLLATTFRKCGSWSNAGGYR